MFGPLKWDRVDANPMESIHKFYSFLPQDSDRIYQFAVSANTEKFSSGMIWATYCTLIHNKVPGKLRTVRYEDPKEDEILIKWDLECSYQSGDIEGFKITYCQVEKDPAERCKDDGASVAVEGANMTTYRLVKLKPFSYYKIDVSILAAAGQSKRSDPIYARTSEGAPSHARVSRISQVTNVSATLLIDSPIHLNGLMREYRIYYSYVPKTDTETEQEQKHPLQISNLTQSFSEEVQLPNLRSNSTYIVYIVACTTKCSTRSDPFKFVTDIGHTDLTTFPEISMDGSDMILEWKQPDRLGGPIEYFQILLKQNGEQIEDVDRYRVPYRRDSPKFDVRIPQSCEQGTNFTAQVRAVTKLDNGQYLYGAWSPQGNYSCGGGVSWLIWLMLAFVAFAGILFFAYLSIRFYHYFRHMKEVPIKLPPGLNSELNGFTHKPPPRSRSSDQSYGKEPFSYPLQPTSRQLDESKDFLSSSELNQGELSRKRRDSGVVMSSQPEELNGSPSTSKDEIDLDAICQTSL
ncbi:Protein sidekick-2 [Orchesella cincta]|uniref:Protein sidekick-2 n=1 Tax=Orchesella cincta TaxID=48709 RepID=A0A1D2MK35_ORCCI|nr:Protein sidekick-2 [Orchesella cincta]